VLGVALEEETARVDTSLYGTGDDDLLAELSLPGLFALACVGTPDEQEQ
jgi:hypothetical protein